MKCKSCNREWSEAQAEFAGLTSCPYCGAGIAAVKQHPSFKNSKDALIYIAREFGPEVLLGNRCRAYFADLAPAVSKRKKKLLRAVNECGAAQILFDHLQGSQEEREIATKQAVLKLTDEFIAKYVAEVTIHEFTTALNWGLGDVQPPSAYVFMGKNFGDAMSLAEAFAKNWEEGKRDVFTKKVSRHFESFDVEIADMCKAAEQEAADASDQEDIIFWRLLYAINPALPGLYWRGHWFADLYVLGNDLLKRLWDADSSLDAVCQSMLTGKILTEYSKIKAPDYDAYAQGIATVEACFEGKAAGDTQLKITLYRLAYVLSGQVLLSLDGRQFRTVDEMADYMRGKLEESVEAFKQLCYRLVDFDGRLDMQLEAWLISLGKQNVLNEWRDSVLYH